MSNPNSPPLEESKIEQEELQPTQKKPSSRRWMITALIVMVLGAGGGTWWFINNNKQNHSDPSMVMAGQPQALPVKLETLTSQSVEQSTTLVGTLDAPRAITIKSELEGRINQILVTEGTRVRSGEVLFVLESDNLEAELSQARARLQNAEARLAQLKAGNRSEDIAEAQAQLNQAIARLNNAKGGARPEEIAEVQAQVQSAQAELELAKDRVVRYKKLQEEGAISDDQFAEILKTERQATASLTEAKRRLDGLTKGRKADLDELQAEVEQARQNLRRLENGARVEEIAQAEADVAQEKALINSIEVRIRKTEIVAPFSGIIGDIPVKLGDYVDSENELTTITENNVLEVNLSIPLEQAKNLTLGLPVLILDGSGQTLTSGKISFISPNVTPNTQLVLAKATLDDSSKGLFNQGSVTTRIIWSESQGVLVPSSAVSRLGDKTFVFVAQTGENNQPDKPELIAKQTLVKLGSLQGNNYQVLEGLQVGDRIVTAGIMNLRDDTPIMPLPE